ncbi:unannotated protein [freshwater metagenome]|uniref:Unannotated protein n=1 Tax=freshwater metagenome TaxID=449393 RepID=A0A6J7N1U6_9ZZZZ
MMQLPFECDYASILLALTGALLHQQMGIRFFQHTRHQNSPMVCHNAYWQNEVHSNPAKCAGYGEVHLHKIHAKQFLFEIFRYQFLYRVLPVMFLDVSLPSADVHLTCLCHRLRQDFFARRSFLTQNPEKFSIATTLLTLQLAAKKHLLGFPIAEIDALNS